MTDLETRLRALRVPASAPGEDVVLADVRRARTAAGRRRAVRLATGGAGLLAVGAVATTVVLSNQPQGPTQADIASTAPSQSGRIDLVDYTGAQREGFQVAKVPDGYVLQGATPFSLDVAPAGDTSSLDSFVGKLVVMLQSQDASFDKTGKAVTVHGSAGYLRTQDAARILEYSDGTHVVVVQAWNNIGLTDDQLVEFANGVTVTSAAQASVG
ncbi:hypothetical protein SAMN04487968_11122 [Nocardioides terrae]|uniref:Uncharacterized protein n=1 Tax=Nocardioides terrae TaxID=574651 RepID=A0A1I1M253_9ACTN|nr:hypothetical protein [Nocardioides terrae]SFC76693.1 hypothetical protein SAMN04487968_11122 [Nocardioides terrae]